MPFTLALGCAAVNPVIPSSPAKGRRPSDSFNGVTVKHKIDDEVLDIICKNATSRQNF